MGAKKADERLKEAEQRNRTLKIILTLAVISTLLGLAIYFYMNGNEGDKNYKTQNPDGDTVDLEIPSIDDNRFHYYSMNIEGVNVRYFAVIDEDGEAHTAFDACDVCYKTRKGYYQDGEYAVCGNCGQRFSVGDLGTRNTDGGGCWPGYLSHSRTDDVVTIKVSDIQRGKYYFK